jgi:Regulator of cell morphogenesis and NO signaling
MTLIKPEMKMADVIHLNFMLLPVINRFDINLGFGDKSIFDLCLEKKIDTDFFLEIINTFNDEEYFPEKKLRTFDVSLLLQYLQKTHRYYLTFQIPTIEHLIDNLLKSCTSSCENLHLISSFFGDYKTELTKHIGREEKTVFPYINSVGQLYKEKDSVGYLTLSQQYSMKRFAREHDNIDEKLFDLKNILIKYISLPYDSNLCNAVVFELFRLEKDIKDHSRIEDKILKPVVAEMENALKM